MKKITFLSVMLLATLFSSCTNDPTNPNENCSLENSLKLQTGNYWIYSTVKTDTNGLDIPGTEGMDSTIVEGTRVIAGKQPYLVVSYNNVRPDTTYYAVEGGKAYQLLNSVIHIFEEYNCACFPLKWFQFADCSANQWKAVDEVHAGEPYKVVNEKGEPVDTKVQWHYLAEGFSKGNESVAVGNSAVNATAFQTKGFFTFSLLTPENAQFSPSGLRALPFKVNNTFFLADGIGIVKYHSEGFDRFQGPKEIVNGIRKTLIRYSVK